MLLLLHLPSQPIQINYERRTHSESKLKINDHYHDVDGTCEGREKTKIHVMQKERVDSTKSKKTLRIEKPNENIGSISSARGTSADRMLTLYKKRAVHSCTYTSAGRWTE